MTFRGAGGDEVSGYFVPTLHREDDGDGSPAVVLAHEVFGLDVHMREVAERFAAEGFCVLAPDLYAREGVPGPASTPDEPAPAWDIDTIRGAARGLPDRRALADLDGAAAYLGGLDAVDADRIAIVGFCMGGTLAFLSGCTSMRFAGAVDFYGRVFYPELSEAKPTQPLELALNLDRPFLGIFAAEDEGIPVDDVEHMRSVLDAAMKDFEIHVVPGVRHGFFNDRRAGHDARAAAEAWDRTLAFLREL